MTSPHPPQYVTLRDAVYAAAVGEDLILLDVAADQYLCLAGAGGAGLAPGARTLALYDPELADALVANGLAERHVEEVPHDGRAFPPRPRVSALRANYPLPTRGQLRDGVVALADLLVRYRGRSLSQILQTVSGRSPTPPDAATSDLQARVDRFQTWVPYAPVSGKCLLRSFLLLRDLNRHGHDADWVFGVATWPFRAHCWLQVGDLVLDDDVDHVGPFSPIMVR